MQTRFLFIALGLTTTMLVSTPTWAGFSDVNTSHDNKTAIEYVQSNGIVSGYGDGSYRPDNAINRAEFTKIVIASQFSESEINSCTSSSLSDVPEGQWFTPFICLAQQKGIIAGYPDGTFKPAQNISFAEASKIIINTKGIEVGTDEVWFKPFVRQLGYMAAVPTTIDSFEKNVTRGEMAEMIYRLNADVTNKPSRTYAELAGEEEEILFEEDGVMTSEFNGMVLNEGDPGVPYIRYNEEDYSTALENEELTILYFTANWCPICKREIQQMKEALKQIDNDDVIVFEVHIRDNVTTDEEEAIAREHGVAFQHTKVFVQDRERQLKDPSSWNTQRYIDEITSALN